MNLLCFQSIEINEPSIKDGSVTSKICCTNNKGTKSTFFLRSKYENKVDSSHLPLLRLASTMPILNYGLFAQEIRLKFEIANSDLELVNDLLDIFSKDIFINKLVKKSNPYILPQYKVGEEEVTEINARSIAKLIPEKITEDFEITSKLKSNSCGILSSGGKESLLTYGMLKEIGAQVHPLYVNESGGHWRTAIPAYRQFRKNDANTSRLWTNIDRFYTFMLDNMKIIRSDHRKIWNDTYPIRLCIFPAYVFQLLPIFAEREIGNLLIGSEFDDPRTSAYFKDIRHYFGVYDQTQDFDLRMEQWYSKRMPTMRQWSAVRTISGLIVERILTKRYPELAKLQRSCHSCRLKHGRVFPCGKCSKCQGILLFLKANNIDPVIMRYRNKDVIALPERLGLGQLRLDEEEKEHAIYLSYINSQIQGKEHKHVETIHLDKETADIELIPEQFWKPILKILKEYTTGFTKLEENEWKITNSSFS